jgi:spore germination protein KC
MKRAIRWVALALAVASLATLTGCRNYQEVENQDIVVGLAIDKGQQGFRYHMTFEVIDAVAGQSDQIKSKVLEAEGDTIADATDNATKFSDKNLFSATARLRFSARKLRKKGFCKFSIGLTETRNRVLPYRCMFPMKKLPANY